MDENTFTKYCGYCRKHGHTDSECWCTRKIENAFAISVMWGSVVFDASGNKVWKHNPLLMMTEAEQRAENIKNGYLNE